MVSRHWQIRVVGTVLALGTSAGSAASQDVSHRSTAMVIRSQLGSIAEEIVGKLKLAANSAVNVTVQPSFRASLAENAVVEALQHWGYRVFLKSDHDSVRVGLSINVLTDRAQFKEIAQFGYERTVQTELEARSEHGDSVTVLGIFRRAYSDTVSVKDAEVQMPTQGSSTDEEATLFQRLVGPLIVLASGIMVVYLFFTVRS